MSKKGSSTGLVLAAAGIVVAGGAAFYFMQKGGAAPSSTASAKDRGEVVAEVNGDPVYSSEVNAQLLKLTKGQGDVTFEKLDGKAKYVIVRQLAAQKLILEEAYKNGFDKEERVQDRVEEYKKGVVKDEYLAALAKDAVTEDRIRQEYDDVVKNLKGKTQYKARHIVLKSQKDAEDLAAKIEAGESFEKLAQKYSLDKQSAAHGGDLGYLVGGNTIAELDQVITSLPDGSVSKPVKTQYGWHLVKVESRRPAQAQPYDTVKNALARELYQETIQKYVDGIITNAKIEVVGGEQPGTISDAGTAEPVEAADPAAPAEAEQAPAAEQAAPQE